MPPNTHHNHRVFIIGAIYSCSSGKAFDVFKDFSINKNETMLLRREDYIGQAIKSICQYMCVRLHRYELYALGGSAWCGLIIDGT